MKWFDFGANWSEFSQKFVDEERLEQATHSMQTLFARQTFDGLSFLDVGCGSGLFSIAAHNLGARPVVGIDINPVCIETARENADRLFARGDIEFKKVSALDATAFEQLGQFDVVYSWGSLHHTGAMYDAIRLTSCRVKPGGVWVLAIYNRHITSPVWKRIKWLYNHLPAFGQRLMAVIFAGVIYLAKFVVTRRNPLQKERGMDFWYDVIDWIGGYPYEYATPQEIEEFVHDLGFDVMCMIPAQVPTGCNEFVIVETGHQPCAA